MKNKNINKFIGILGIAAIVIFAGLYLFDVVGSTTEKVMNTNPIELKLHPTAFQDYCFLRDCGLPTSYANVCNRNEGTAGDYGANCPIVYFTGAERKLIGSFCTEQPIKKVYSVSANIHTEDFFGTTNRPPFALGMTNNLEKSNMLSEILFTTAYSGSSYPTKDYVLNSAIFTEYAVGEKCFDLYVLGGKYRHNYPAGMDITLNHLNINYDPIECDPSATPVEIQAACDDSDIMTKDICYNYECQHVPVEIIEPPTPEPQGINKIIADIWAWLLQIFESIFTFAIVGAPEVTPGTTETYHLYITAPEPDKDYSDGTFETQYGYWALVDKNGKVLSGETTGVEVTGNYNATAVVTIPANIDNHVILATITQIDSTFDFDTLAWVHGEEYVVTKEAINLNTKFPIPDTPIADGIDKLLSALWDWIRGLFSWFSS